MRHWLLFGGLAVAIAAGLFGIHFYRYRYVRYNADLVRLLPPGDLNVVYADIGILRQQQLLGLLANIKVAPDKEYADFIRETGFDYTRDLEAVIFGGDTAQTFLIGRGRFEWSRLKAFAASHQGACDGDACRVPGSTAGRWVNFISIQPDVLAVAISANSTAADDLRPPGRRVQGYIPRAPVWAKLSHALLMRPVALPLPVQIFAISLQSADSALLWTEPSSLQLKAHFENAATADTARRQLEINTRTLRTALLQKDEKPDRASFPGMLTAGSFQVIGADVVGEWPVYPELLRALQ